MCVGVCVCVYYTRQVTSVTQLAGLHCRRIVMLINCGSCIAAKVGRDSPTEVCACGCVYMKVCVRVCMYVGQDQEK